MHFLIIVTSIMIVCGNETPEKYPVPTLALDERYDRQYRRINHIKFESQANQKRNRQGNINLPRRGFNVDTQYPNRDDTYNKINKNIDQNELIDLNNFKSALLGNLFSTNQRKSYRSIDVSHDLNIRGSQFRDHITNTSRRNFGINNEYQNKHDAINDENHGKYKANSKTPTRQQHEVILDDDGEHNKNITVHEAIKKDSSDKNVNIANEEVIKMNNDTNINRDVYDMDSNINNDDIVVSSSPDKEKEPDTILSETTTDSEITSAPFQDDFIDGNKTNDEKWSWNDDIEVNTDTSFILDDRIAFVADKCATGMARVAGKCVKIDT